MGESIRVTVTASVMLGLLSPIEKQRECHAELGALYGYAELGARCFASGQARGLAVEKYQI